MPSTDPDDRLLAALRGTNSEEATSDELTAAIRIGAAARAAQANEPAVEPVPDLASMWTSLSERALPEAPVADPSEDADVVPLRRRSAQRWGTLAAAAAVVMVAGIAAVALWSRSADEAVVARQALERLGDAGQAEAVLVEVDEGFALDVSFDGVDPGEGYLEVWLINTEVTQLVSLGPVQSDGRYLLPDGLNPSAFPVVDISIEHFDGDPTHSGDSVFRGVLEL